MLTLFFGQLSDTHTHTHSGNSRAHNTAIPQPACVRIVYSSRNIMLSILFNDMHSSWEGEEEEEGVLGLDRHFSYWQCLIQSFRDIPQPWSRPISIVSPAYTRPQLLLLLLHLPRSHSEISQQMAQKEDSRATFSCPVFLGGYFFPLSLSSLYFFGESSAIVKRLRLRLIS